MDNLQKKEKLIAFANSVLEDERYKDEINYLIQGLKTDKSKVIQAYLDYDMDLFAYGNEVYQRELIQLILHIHNYLAGSWHPVRHATICEFVQQANPQTIIDIGFGVPGSYIKNFVFKNPETKLKLCDINEYAFKFANLLLAYWNNEAFKNQIDFVKTDMDTLEYLGNADLYIFQDSIEHTKYPEKYLISYVEKSPPYAKFLLSMPIAPLIPMHYIAWEKEHEAKKWLKDCGLEIVQQKIITVNRAVDLFADDLDFANLVILCRKNKDYVYAD